MNNIIRRKYDEITFEEAYRLFLEDKKAQGCAQTTLNKYEDTYYVFSKQGDVPPDLPLHYLNKDVINCYITNMTGNVKPGTINTRLRVIRSFINWCVEQHYMEPFKITMVKHQEEVQKVYSRDDLSKLLAPPDTKSSFSEWRTYCAICMMTSLGTRAGTLCAIKTNDVDFTRNEIIYTHLKNKRLAILPLSPSLSKILKEYLRLFDRDETFLFCDVGEQQLTTSALRQSIERYCKKRGVVYKGVHSFRRSFAKEFILNGGNAFELQRILTHSTIAMSARYVNLYSDDLKAGYEALSPLDTIQNADKHNKFKVKKKSV